MTGMKRFWEFKAEAKGSKVGELYIYGSIVPYRLDDTDVTAKSFKDDLETMGSIDTLNVYINSPGGSVFQGQAIYSILRRFREKATVNVYVDGLAASIASVIAMAGTTVTMPANAMMMIHNPWRAVAGNAAELRKAADDLDKIRVSLVEAYMERVSGKLSEDKLSELMDAETWLTAQECLDYGFCDQIVEAKDVAACVDPDVMAHYRNTPEMFRTTQAPATGRLSDQDRQARIDAAQKNLSRIKAIKEAL